MRKCLTYASILVALLLCSCSPRFYASESSQGMDFTISAGRRSIDGTMVVRELDGNARAVGISRFGMTLFDITVKPDGTYVTNSCADFLDRNVVKKLIVKNIRMDR